MFFTVFGASCEPSEDRQVAPSSVATPKVTMIHGELIAPDEWLEERWVLRGQPMHTFDGPFDTRWNETTIHRRVRRPRPGEYEVIRWRGQSPNPELHRVKGAHVRNERPHYRDFDELSFPHTLLALPLHGEVREGEPAPFIVPLLADIAIPLTREDRIISRVTRIEGDIVFVDVSYASGKPPKNRDGVSVQIDSLVGTVEISVPTGRPIRLQYDVSGSAHGVRGRDDRYEPIPFTDNISCEWTYPRGPSDPSLGPPRTVEPWGP